MAYIAQELQQFIQRHAANAGNATFLALVLAKVNSAFPLHHLQLVNEYIRSLLLCFKNNFPPNNAAILIL